MLFKPPEVADPELHWQIQQAGAKSLLCRRGRALIIKVKTRARSHCQQEDSESLHRVLKEGKGVCQVLAASAGPQTVINYLTYPSLGGKESRCDSCRQL